MPEGPFGKKDSRRPSGLLMSTTYYFELSGKKKPRTAGRQTDAPRRDDEFRICGDPEEKQAYKAATTLDFNFFSLHQTNILAVFFSLSTEPAILKELSLFQYIYLVVSYYTI